MHVAYSRPEECPGARVQLTWREIHLCGVCAVSRTVRNLAKGTTPRWGQSRSRLNTEDEFMGAIAELAVAKHLNRFWAGMSYGTVDATVADVRAVSEEGHRLILHPDDRDDVPVVLALVARQLLPAVVLRGWIMGFNGKRDDWWEDPTGSGRPAYFVPDSALLAMEDFDA